MTIIVTGGAGFIGRELVALLLAEGRAVIALDTCVDAFAPHPGLKTIAGDLASSDVRRLALADGCSGLVHLATVPGAAAEADPALSRRINVDAMTDLLEELRTAVPGCRLVYASSIAVFGDPLPHEGVDDTTPIAPRMIYAGHKAMMEVAVTMMSCRGDVDGVTVRLPGVLARPKGPSGMKSAFMSDIFHALHAGECFICPVSPEATIWAQSVQRCAANLAHALVLDTGRLPPTRTVTLPAQHIAMTDLIDEIARQCGVSPDLVDFAPNPALEDAFGKHPALATPAAIHAGFADDGDVATLVANALEGVRRR
jgi:nucleoside-diphosphate-sugar epimerase